MVNPNYLLTGFLGAKNLSASLIQPRVSPKFPSHEEYVVMFPSSLRSFLLFHYTALEHFVMLVGNEISPIIHLSFRFHERDLKETRLNEQDYPKQT
jgi:hypothetical protein